MADREHEERVDAMLGYMADLEDALEALRGATSAVVVYRGEERIGWLCLGEIEALDVLLTRAAAEELDAAVLAAAAFWVGDDVEEDGEDEDEYEWEEDDDVGFSL